MTYKLLPQPPKKNKQVEEYLLAIQKGRNTSFVSLSDRGWVVRSLEPATKLEIFASKEAAVGYAERVGAKVVITE